MRTDLIHRWGLDLLIDEIHGKVNRRSSNYFKTSKKRHKVFFVCCYDPEKPERKTYKRWKNRDNLRYATQLAKLDFHDYPAERAKYEKAFAQQSRYKSLFHYIVACHKLALDRVDAMTQKPSGNAMKWLELFYKMKWLERCQAKASMTELIDEMSSGVSDVCMGRESTWVARRSAFG